MKPHYLRPCYLTLTQRDGLDSTPPPTPKEQIISVMEKEFLEDPSLILFIEVG